MRLLCSALACASMVVVSAIVFGFLCSGLGTLSAWAAIFAGVVAAVAAWVTTGPQTQRKLHVWDWLMLTVFALASLRAFLWVVYWRGDEICVLSRNNLGDLSLHLTLIRYLASGVPFWPESPIISNFPLTYPLGVDLFNSILELCGVETIRGLVWTGLAGAALTAYALWLWGGAFGLAAFLFNGGLSGFAILRDLRIEDFQRDMVWKNLFLAMFVTQRALLFAIPAGLILLHAWRQQYFRGSQRIPPLWLQLLLYASMPLFSIHTFLFLSLVLLAIFASSLFSVRTPMGGVRRTKDATDLLTFVALAVVPATMAVLLVTGFFSASAEIRWAPDWIIGGPDGHFATWFWDFGVTIPLCLMLVFILFFDKDRESRCFVWMAASLFGLCCLFSFAPWEWDNMKLMLWSWLVIAPYLWGKVLAPLVLPARVALCVLLLFSGGVSLIGGLDASQGYVIAHRSELAAWQKATSGIPANVRFATVPDYNHPLLLLGRKVASGYEWHLWSHGLDFRRDFELLRAALSGQVSWRVSAPRLGVEWLALRKKDLPQTKPPGEPPPPEAFGALYDLRPLFKPGPASQEPPQLPPQSVDLSW